MMPHRAPTLRALLRSTTASLRPAASTQFTKPLSQIRPRSRSPSRSPSPPPPYQARNISLAASTTHWTRFSTPYTYSSVRTFTSSASRLLPNASGASSSPQAAQQIEQVIEEIQELYGTARDEFEIAAEETEKNTTYAAEDRAAAREELDRLLEYYSGVVEGADGAVAEEVKRRVGQRVRELEQAVRAMEESAAHGD
ncbi:hypothetical protein BU26DRAFT_514387 [Trematosphaeria pertusa]|uniref:Uncharacterized protein n=1 Tax=Trematosphaeria pertusa TaxID=390896 RepID=A0A6A6IW25_9PLEO|nr:uncharacterized protein BU26DRAFT_514387 [Trematosphaeria pertusa]KAF2254478.1 hypothetical protein BU26DRAFT_514387 [Trematosphaeria pertusa]